MACGALSVLVGEGELDRILRCALLTPRVVLHLPLLLLFAAAFFLVLAFLSFTFFGTGEEEEEEEEKEGEDRRWRLINLCPSCCCDSGCTADTYSGSSISSFPPRT